MPEFQNKSDDSSGSSNIPITTNDLVALRIKATQNNTSQITIENTTDVDEFKKIVNMTYTYHSEGATIFPFDDYSYHVKSLMMVRLSQDRNTGYNIINPIALGNDNQTQQRLQSPAV